MESERRGKHLWHWGIGIMWDTQWRNRNANVWSHIVKIWKKMIKSCILHPWWIYSTTLDSPDKSTESDDGLEEDAGTIPSTPDKPSGHAGLAIMQPLASSSLTTPLTAAAHAANLSCVHSNFKSQFHVWIWNCLGPIQLSCHKKSWWLKQCSHSPTHNSTLLCAWSTAVIVDVMCYPQCVTLAQ
jgi:hypothetical protein